MIKTLQQKHDFALDEAIKKAIINKGFDPTDLAFLTIHGTVGTYKGTSTLVIGNAPICSWTEPKYEVAMNGDMVRVDCTFDFKEL